MTVLYAVNNEKMGNKSLEEHELVKYQTLDTGPLELVILTTSPSKFISSAD